MYESMTWDQRVAADAAVSERVAFIRRTYLHVAGAIVALAVLLAALVNFVPDEVMMRLFTGRFSWLIILGLFMGASYLASYMAQSHMPVSTQYVGLGLYTVAEAVIFWPLIWLCTNRLGYEGVITQAVILTLAIAVGLTVSVFVTKADFSWMRTALNIAFWVVLGLILLSLFGLINLGVWFVVGMVVLMSASILYQTSNVLHHYGTNQHVGAALSIFAAIATLFWYVIQLLMYSRD